MRRIERIGRALGLATWILAGAAVAEIDPRDYGAKADGRTVDTEALQKAIDTGAERKERVVLRDGIFLSGTVLLRSGTTLRIEKGAVLRGSTDLDDYPVLETDNKPYRNRWLRSLVRGVNLSKVTLEGAGTIDGNRLRDPGGEAGMRGPHTVFFRNSKEITVRGLKFEESGNYANLLMDCEDVEFDGIEVWGGWDGVHWRVGKNFRLRNCRFFTGDDNVAGRGWHQTLIENCDFNSSCNGIRVFADVHDLVVRDCRFAGPGKRRHFGKGGKERDNMLAGIIFQPGAWDQDPSTSRNIRFENLTMENLMTAIHCSLREGNSLEGFHVRGLKATGVYGTACSIESWGGKIRDASLEDYEVSFAYPQDVPAVTKWRPAGNGSRKLPGWAFFAKNVEGLRLENVKWTADPPPKGPAVVLDQVDELKTDQVTVNGKAFTP